MSKRYDKGQLDLTQQTEEHGAETGKNRLDAQIAKQKDTESSSQEKKQDKNEM